MAIRQISIGFWFPCLPTLMVLWSLFSGCGAGFRLGTSDIRFVQSRTHADTNVPNGVGTTTAVFSTPPQVGNTMVVVVWGYHGLAAGIANLVDSASNFWFSAIVSNNSGGNIPIAIWYTPVLATSGNYTITVYPTATGTQNINLVAAEFSGLDFSAPLDVTNQGSNDSMVTSATTNTTLPPIRTPSLVVAGAVFNLAQSTITETGGMSVLFTDLGSGATGQGLYQITQATTGRSAQWTVSTNAQNAAVIAVFKGKL